MLNPQIIQAKIEQTFKNLGFEKVHLSRDVFWKYGENYCRIVYEDLLKGFIIESSKGADEAAKYMSEDSDLYFLGLSESELLAQLKSDIQQNYMD